MRRENRRGGFEGDVGWFVRRRVARSKKGRDQSVSGLGRLGLVVGPISLYETSTAEIEAFQRIQPPRLVRHLTRDEKEWV